MNAPRPDLLMKLWLPADFPFQPGTPEFRELLDADFHFLVAALVDTADLAQSAASDARATQFRRGMALLLRSLEDALNEALGPNQ